MSADPLRLFEDAGLPDRIRQDLAQARDADAGYDTEDGLARFSALVALAPASGVVASAVEAAAPHAAAGAVTSATEAATAANAAASSATAASSAAAAGAMTSATAGTAAGVLGAMGTKVAVGVAVLGIAIGAATLGSAGNDGRAWAPVTARVAPPARAAVEASRQQLARVAADEAAAATSPADTAATDVRPAQPGISAPSATSAPASSATRQLEEETEHLAALREAAAADPARALLMAEEGARRFPRGVFAQEREVIAIRALAASGRGAEARTRAAAFRIRHPESPAAEGLRRIAEDGAAP
jgi:hypothetical protein